ncbi:phosphatase PAP2 family protein [Candidatus Woesearchaeota archaeon]|nr:phosphatase PAP2 family protein [Candidatus Woesearchaeota archaeon]
MRCIECLAWIVVFIISLLLDKTIAYLMPAYRLSFLNRAFIFIGQEFFIFAIAVIITLSFVYYKKKDSIKLWLGLVSTGIITVALKYIISRPRPFMVFDYQPLAESVFKYSFPSLTTASVFAMLPFMLKNYPKLRWLWWLIAAVIGFSRLYVGLHYISDIIFGALLGWFIGSTFLRHSRK